MAEQLNSEEMDLLDLVRAELGRASADRKHPFRYFVVANSDYGAPELRTVVLRKTVGDLRLRFYTDARSPKIEQFRDDTLVSALFYHPKKKLQARVRTHAEILPDSDPVYRELRQQIAHSASLADYTTQSPPGTVLQNPAQAQAGEEIHFAVIELVPFEFDILQLRRAGHRRALYRRDEGYWEGKALVP
ncbi:MAG: pyridoxamine 5'-phosphate oxidase family protein [Bacteroidota bacterium]